MAVDRKSGIAIRYVQQWDNVPALDLREFDVWIDYGRWLGRFNPEGVISMAGDRETDGGANQGPMRAEGPAEWSRRVERVVHQALGGREAVTLENVAEAFTYQPWNGAQQDCGDAVRDVLLLAAKQILRSVPPGHLRDRAIDTLIDCRMIANAGITFRGRF